MKTPMRLSPHLLMNDKTFTVYMNSHSLVNTASGLTLAGAGMALTHAHRTVSTWLSDGVDVVIGRYRCRCRTVSMAHERHHAFRLDHTAPLSHLPTRQSHYAEWRQHHPRHRPPLHRCRQQREGLKKARRTSWEVRRALLNPRLAGGRTPTPLCLR